jgi:hypothetical protein
VDLFNSGIIRASLGADLIYSTWYPGETKMNLFALVALMCGPINYTSKFTEAKIKNCYKEMITCVEHRQVSNPKLEPAVEACILEM